MQRLQFVSSNNGSNIDIYGELPNFWGNDSEGVLAETFHYNNNTRVNPNTSNWYYAEIHLNDTELSDDSISNSEAQGTIAHEIGHAFGLAHNNRLTANSIMSQYYVRTTQVVKQIDNNTLNYLYP